MPDVCSMHGASCMGANAGGPLQSTMQAQLPTWQGASPSAAACTCIRILPTARCRLNLKFIPCIALKGVCEAELEVSRAASRHGDGGMEMAAKLTQEDNDNAAGTEAAAASLGKLATLQRSRCCSRR